MKGRKLNALEVLNLEVGDKVYIEPISDMYEDEIGEATIILDQNEKCILSSKKENYSDGWGIGGYKDTDPEEWLAVYEWIENKHKPKTYKGSEILHMIEEDILKEDDVIVSEFNNEEYKISDMICIFYINLLIDFQPFTIKQKPVDYITACNSGKNIKPLSLKDEKKYHPYTYWLGFLVSLVHHGNSLDLINDKWLVEQ